MGAIYANNVVGTLSISVGAIDTVLQLTPGQGDGFPTPGAEQWFYVTLVDALTGENEICRVTGRTGDALTVVRGVDNTVARSWAIGTVIEMRLTAQMLRELQEITFNEDDFLRRSGGDVFGPLRLVETDGATNGWTQDAIGGGDYLLDNADPNRNVYLYPQALNGDGRVIAYRLQHSMPVRDVTSTTRDLISGATGDASFLLVYKNAAAGTLRLVNAVGNSAWVRGNFFHVMWYDVGAPTIVPGPGVTIHAPDGYLLRPRSRRSVITFTALGPAEWLASGDLAEVP